MNTFASISDRPVLLCWSIRP